MAAYGGNEDDGQALHARRWLGFGGGALPQAPAALHRSALIDYVLAAETRGGGPLITASIHDDSYARA
jgi:hypothetical protein